MQGTLTWNDESLGDQLRCRICGHEGAGERVATVDPGWREPFHVRRCTGCRSLDLLDDPLASSSNDLQVDQYVEGGAGIGSLADALNQVDPDRVQRFLDVGCNVGFALDLARATYGWDVVGVEPSLAGRRGAADLDLDIRPVHLDEATDLGDPFDLVLASEVIEHVLEPLQFARVLAAQLAPGGRLLLTTPAAEHVVPGQDEGEVLVALSPGLHVALASAEGLEQLLRRAGFGAVRVTRRRGTLHVVAAIDPDDPLEPGQGRIDALALERYYALRARSAPPESALANGAATRFVRSAVSRGAFDAAAELVPTMLDAIHRRHGLDLRNPRDVAATLAAGHDAPWHLASASYALGMTALIHDGHPARAADLFDLTSAAVRSWQQQAGLLDLDSADLAIQAVAHRALALARCGDGSQAPAAAAALDRTAAEHPTRAAALAEMQCRVLVELVARGSYDAATELLDVAVRRTTMLAGSPADTSIVTVLDAAFSLGMLHLNTGAPGEAARWFRRCERLAVARSDAHALHLLDQCRAHLAIAESAEPPTEGSAVDSWPAAAQLVHQVDVHWTDAGGTFLEGWAHLGPEPVRAITVRVGEASVRRAPLPTPHLVEYWPEVPEVAAAGFSAYVPGTPHGLLSLVVSTAARDVELELDLPAEAVPTLPPFETHESAQDRIRKLIADAPPGPILALGIRASSADSLADQMEIFGEREVIGVDIHEGLGVDVVGDVHRLSELVPEGHFAAVVSTTVLEHVAMPWVVAAECAKVLRLGGRAVHVVPWTWPTHAEPSDYWRMSPNGLRQLFGPSTGFTILDGGEIEGTVVLPLGSLRERELRMPTTASAASSWIAAEKVDERARNLDWAYDTDDGIATARAYPTDGLARPPTSCEGDA